MVWLHHFFVLCAGLVVTGISPAAVYVADIDGPVPHFSSDPTDAKFRLLIRDELPNPEAFEEAAARAADSTLRQRRARLDPLIEGIARRYAVDPALVRAVIEVESGFRSAAVSPRGAVGAMQLMPATAARYRVTDRRDERQNIAAGVIYLKSLLVRFQGNLALALAAYNAGGLAVDRHGQVIPPYRETMLYVPQVLEAYARYRAVASGNER